MQFNLFLHVFGITLVSSKQNSSPHHDLQSNLDSLEYYSFVFYSLILLSVGTDWEKVWQLFSLSII